MDVYRSQNLLLHLVRARIGQVGLENYVVELRAVTETLGASADEIDELLAELLRSGPELLAESPSMIGPLLPLLDEEGEVKSLGAIEAEVMKFAIQKYRGQMSEAARRLRIGRSTLYRKLDLQLAREPMHITHRA